MGMDYKRMMGVTDGFDMKTNREKINIRGGNGGEAKYRLDNV